MQKFSDLLKTPIIRVTVASSDVYFLHSGLLTRESDRFALGLNGHFAEAKNAAIDLVDENPALFGFFIEYIYRGSQGCRILTLEDLHHSEYLILARLYAMGERLQALGFQKAVANEFHEALTGSGYIGDGCICSLLNIACLEMTERAHTSDTEDMRKRILQYASECMDQLTTSDMFKQTRKLYPEVERMHAAWFENAKVTHPFIWDTLVEEAKKMTFAPENEYDA